ncbi:hypothetical protein BT96DRAFT_1001106 [Gymnopus androsaceus JB14]|uniref:Uncharacterized protein n=1 Tax=Gymnopus androsaceus JB14 TaxID=1447944 RepID=A0A6A4H1N2_9AGAR|nr:hypothetical protein BT96DRAFT_1001106 [Gymnopus androsaceus JB14]
MSKSAENNKLSTAPESQPAKPIDVEDVEDMENTKPSTKKKNRKLSPFTTAQLAHIDSFFPAFEQLLHQHKLHLGKSGKEHDPSVVSDWINKTVDQILRSPKFKGKLNATLKMSKQWKMAVNDHLKNHCNNVFVKNNHDSLIRNALATDKGTRAHDTTLKATHALVAFQSTVAAKECFRMAKDEEVKVLAAMKHSELPSLNAGAAYQLALTELWNDADQELYGSQLTEDIFKNQDEFQMAMLMTMDILCQSGALGPCELVLLSGFHNKKNQVVAYRLNTSSHSNSDGPQFLDDQVDSGEKRDSDWWSFLDAHLGCHPEPEPEPKKKDIAEFVAKDQLFYVNNLGVPVLKEVDLDDISRVQLASCLTNFLKALWYAPSVPFGEIQANPSDYYDTATFAFPIKFTSPKVMTWAELFDFAGYLTTISHPNNPNPFTFQSKSNMST